MLLFLLAAASIDARVDACVIAVHEYPGEASTACDTSDIQIDVFDPKAPSDACLAALKYGVQVGKAAPALNPVMRAGLLKDFDKKIAQCRTPVAKQETPTIPQTNLWD